MIVIGLVLIALGLIFKHDLTWKVGVAFVVVGGILLLAGTPAY